MEHILGQYSMLLISPHKEVLAALPKRGIEITIIYPDRKLKSEYIQRFRKRGSSEAFMALLDTYWDDFFGPA